MIKKILLIILVFFFFTHLSNAFVSAETESEKLDKLSKEIAQYQSEITRLQSEASTLSNQIAQYDAQIRLTSLKIEETEEKINLLGFRIGQLEASLDSLSKAFASRAVETYKMSRLGEPIYLLVSASDLKSAFASFYYLKKIQESDRDLLFRLEKAQITYTDQKTEQEELQEELGKQKVALDAQKSAKASLLTQTKNDEKRYQSLLTAARAEYEAIQAIVAGKGQEEEVGNVSQGQRIASIISGASCNSSGEHLHFIISQNKTTQNPFNYLRGVDYENCSGSSCGASDGDSFNPSGSWDWPVSPRIKFSQGYGPTWAVRNTWVGKIYQFHNGIDINSPSSEVRAVRAGKLFRGSYSGSSGCRLRYVRVDHDEGDLDTFYLHVNY